MTIEQFKAGEKLKNRIYNLEYFRKEVYELSSGLYISDDKYEIMDLLNNKIGEMISRLEKEFSEL